MLSSLHCDLDPDSESARLDFYMFDTVQKVRDGTEQLQKANNLSPAAPITTHPSTPTPTTRMWLRG